MQTCSNCGASVRNEARFCTSCGTRLNAPMEQDATAAWPAATATPAPTPDPSVWDKVRESIRTGEAASPTIVPHDEASNDTDDEQDAPATSAETEEPEQGDTFSWSWGVPPTAADDDEASSDQAATDDESSQPAGVGASVGGGSAPASVDTAEVENTSDGDGSDETLAAWATTWNLDEDSDDAAEPADAADVEAAVSHLSQAVAEADATGNAEEDTVAKAERLIRELQSLIPALVAPKPVPPVTRLKPKLLRSSLESARGSADWSELRDVLTAANDNPRDIEHMMSLSSRVNDMLSLLDDRDQLAKAVDDVSAQLREAEDEDEA